MDNYEPKRLNIWTMPDSYFGATWPATYVFLGQHRGGDSLSRSNFICALEAIGGESETVQVVRESHWAVGWVEWIAIHQDDCAALEKADEVMACLDDYPVVNEDHWLELEWNEVSDYWAALSIRKRAEYCKEHDISIFAARRDYMPPDDTGSLFDSLRS